jgi:hypothetical protein
MIRISTPLNAFGKFFGSLVFSEIDFLPEEICHVTDKSAEQLGQGSIIWRLSHYPDPHLWLT